MDINYLNSNPVRHKKQLKLYILYPFTVKIYFAYLNSSCIKGIIGRPILIGRLKILYFKYFIFEWVVSLIHFRSNIPGIPDFGLVLVFVSYSL